MDKFFAFFSSILKKINKEEDTEEEKDKKPEKPASNDEYVRPFVYCDPDVAGPSRIITGVRQSAEKKEKDFIDVAHANASRVMYGFERDENEIVVFDDDDEFTRPPSPNPVRPYQPDHLDYREWKKLQKRVAKEMSQQKKQYKEEDIKKGLFKELPGSFKS